MGDYSTGMVEINQRILGGLRSHRFESNETEADGSKLGPSTQINLMERSSDSLLRFRVNGRAISLRQQTYEKSEGIVLGCL